MGGSGETQPRITRTLVAEVSIWEFPKIGVPYFGGPYNMDPTSPIFGITHLKSIQPTQPYSQPAAKSKTRKGDQESRT